MYMCVCVCINTTYSDFIIFLVCMFLGLIISFGSPIISVCSSWGRLFLLPSAFFAWGVFHLGLSTWVFASPYMLVRHYGKCFCYYLEAQSHSKLPDSVPYNLSTSSYSTLTGVWECGLHKPVVCLIVVLCSGLHLLQREVHWWRMMTILLSEYKFMFIVVTDYFGLVAVHSPVITIIFLVLSS